MCVCIFYMSMERAIRAVTPKQISILLAALKLASMLVIVLKQVIAKSF